jgi:8-oxo-dGTP diphosphatase
MIKQIAISVVEHADCFLIGQRPSGVPLAGLWEFPGGKLEPGESEQQAAVRECLEETGLSIQANETYLVQEEEYPHGRVKLYFIACQLRSQKIGQPDPPFLWVPRHQLENYEFPAGNRELLRLLANR